VAILSWREIIAETYRRRKEEAEGYLGQFLNYPKYLKEDELERGSNLRFPHPHPSFRWAAPAY
jgi:hypothetical protein